MTTEPVTTPETPPETPDKDARTMAMLCHLLALSTFIGIPFGNIIGPLIIWAIKKDEHPFVDDQGKESLNFQITMTIVAIVAFILVFLFIGIPLLIALAIFVLVMVIVAAIKANEGVAYRYPLTIRFIT